MNFVLNAGRKILCVLLPAAPSVPLCCPSVLPPGVEGQVIFLKAVLCDGKAGTLELILWLNNVATWADDPSAKLFFLSVTWSSHHCAEGYIGE